jgi:hypothetical protein
VTVLARSSHKVKTWSVLVAVLLLNLFAGTLVYLTQSESVVTAAVPVTVPQVIVAKVPGKTVILRGKAHKRPASHKARSTAAPTTRVTLPSRSSSPSPTVRVPSPAKPQPVKRTVVYNRPAKTITTIVRRPAKPSPAPTAALTAVPKPQVLAADLGAVSVQVDCIPPLCG